MSLPAEGKPPKDEGSIRKALRSIQSNADLEGTSGPLADGLDALDQIVTASFYDKDVARQYQRRLNEIGIPSSTAMNGRKTQVLVDFEDRERAAAAYLEHQVVCPDQRPQGIRKDFDLLIFGLAIGLSLGTILIVQSFGNAKALMSPLVFGVIGAILGHLFDRVRDQFRRTGKLRLGVWEFLLLATLPALFIFAIRLLPVIITM